MFRSEKPVASKRETIIEYLKNTVLPLITEENGYTHTVKTIRRGLKSRTALGESDYPAIFIPGVDERRSRITHNQFKADLSVVLVGYVKNSSDSPNDDATGAQQDLDELIADMTKAIETDPEQGGNVKNTQITSISTDDGDLLPIAGCVMTVEFMYVSEGTTP